MVEWSATASQGPSVLMAPKPEREVKATGVLSSAYAVALAVPKLSLPFCEGEEGCLVPFFGCVIFVVDVYRWCLVNVSDICEVPSVYVHVHTYIRVFMPSLRNACLPTHQKLILGSSLCVKVFLRTSMGRWNCLSLARCRRLTPLVCSATVLLCNHPPLFPSVVYGSIVI